MSAPALTPDFSRSASPSRDVRPQTPDLAPGTATCWCAACGESFRSEAGFNAHRVGRHQPNERRCLTAQEMTDRGMARNAKGQWITGFRDTF
jgi:hypothetical protein